MVLPAPPDPFPPFNFKIVPAGQKLFRIHEPKFAGAQFNPCMGGPSRFSPLANVDGSCLPTLYAAETFEAAVHESLFHDQPYGSAKKFITIDKVISRAVSTLTVNKDIRLASLNQPDLMKLALSRADLIDTDATAYGQTARWAEALHRADAKLAGLMWTSRRCDPAQACILFEGRIPADAIAVTETISFSTAPDLLLQIREFGKRADITITV